MSKEKREVLETFTVELIRNDDFQEPQLRFHIEEKGEVDGKEATTIYNALSRFKLVESLVDWMQRKSEEYTSTLFKNQLKQVGDSDD